MSPVGYNSLASEKGSPEYPLDKENDRRDKADAQYEVLETTLVNNLNYWQGVSPCFQKPAYRFLISVGVIAKPHPHWGVCWIPGLAKRFQLFISPPKLAGKHQTCHHLCAKHSHQASGRCTWSHLSTNLHRRDVHKSTWSCIVENVAVLLQSGSLFNLVSLWHLLNRMEGSANILPTSGNKHVFPKVVTVLVEGILDYTLANRFWNLMAFFYWVTRPRRVPLHTQGMISVSFQSCGLRLMRSGREVLEKYQPVIAQARWTFPQDDVSRLTLKRFCRNG